MKCVISRVFRLAFLGILFLQIGRANANITVSVSPGTQTLTVGDNLVYGALVVTTGGEQVTGYQWFLSANTNGPFTSVGTAAAYTIHNVQVTNTGYYYVKITYQSGGGSQTLSSTVVKLTVDPHPRVVSQPASATREPGSNVVFSITALGEPPLFFQWRRNGGGIADDGRITGTSGTNLSIQNLSLSDSAGYDIVVQNAYGSTTSSVATLNVTNFPPVIISATNAFGKQGHLFNYSMIVTGTPPFTFGADGLPDGLSVNYTNGLISGIPSVFGAFNITLYATNIAQTATGSLALAIADDIPVIVSPTNAVGKQGFLLTYPIVATNDPAWFNAGPLPLGMNVDNASGIISGIPLVYGLFSVTIDVSNAYGAASQIVTFDITNGSPIITGALTKTGKQGVAFSYTIKATNNPATYSAAPLPEGLSIDPNSGVISGVPLVFGTFAVTISSYNMFGSDSKTLTVNISTGAPAITSALTATAPEEGLLNYTIKANNSPTSFWATGLPFGANMNTNTGAITGIPIYAGSYSVQLYAANAWGVGTATLQLTVDNKTITGLAIADVTTNYFSPYLLEFKFALRDSDDPLTSHAVVASPSLMTVQAFEDGVPVSPSETGVILQRVGSEGAKVLKGYLVLDFTASVASLANGDVDGNGISDAVDAEVAAAQDFVDHQPEDSQIGVFEFHRDDEVPQQVMSLTTDKVLLKSAIAGIWTNYVQGFPAASRAWDAVGQAITALGPTNKDESHYIVLMADQDDASTNTLANLITTATAAGVQIYTVGFGSEVDAASLQNLSTSTLGRYYPATDIPTLTLSFAQIGKDLGSQYVLRWATLKRSATTFMPTFQITYQGFTAMSPPNPPPVVTGTNFVVVTNMSGNLDTNMVLLYTTNYIIPPYQPTAYAGNVLGGWMRLVSDADVHPAGITLRAIYAPRYIRQVRVHYRPNYPVTVSLDSTNSGEILAGWSLTQTNDGAGGQWALLSSPDTNNLATSIPFAGFGSMLSFTFSDPITASNAFSDFYIDNTIYTNTASTNFYGLALTNAIKFTNVFGLPPAHGTPIPWLISYGFTNNFDAAELLDPNGNGLATWQDYIAGLNPTNANSTFDVGIASVQFAPLPTPPQVSFNTVIGRTYRIDWASSAGGPWYVLRDGIDGTGGIVNFNDFRDLHLTRGMFYRVAVEGP